MAERNPEQPIEPVQFGTDLLPLEHGELLPKCDRFQSEFVARHEKGADVCNQRESEHNHQSILVERSLRTEPSCRQTLDFSLQAAF